MTANIAAKISCAFIDSSNGLRRSNEFWIKQTFVVAVKRLRRHPPHRSEITKQLLSMNKGSGSPCSFDGIPINRVCHMYLWQLQCVFFCSFINMACNVCAPANRWEKNHISNQQNIVESRNNRIDIGGTFEGCALMENLYFQKLCVGRGGNMLDWICCSAAYHRNANVIYGLHMRHYRTE